MLSSPSIFKSLRKNGRFTSHSRRFRGRHAARCAPLAGEQLETRDLLATFVVTDFGDALGAAGTLRDVITQANNLPGPDRIEFGGAAGAVQLEQGQILITDSLEIDGTTSLTGQVTIQANVNPNPPDRIFRIDDGTPTQHFVELNSLRLTGGDALDGGAILNGEDLTIIDSVITGNTAEVGGGITNFGFVRIDQSTLYGNTATYLGGGLFNVGSAEVLNSFVQSNHATALTAGVAYGGGIHNEGLAVLIHSQVVGNSAIRQPGMTAHGGGISARLGAFVDLIDSDVLENHSDDFGGGVFLGDGAAMIAQLNTNIFANDADDSGGGVYLTRGAMADITDSNVYINLAEERGGGIFAGEGTNLVLVNSTVDDNSNDILLPDGSGGGLYLGEASGSAGPFATILDSYVRGNFGGDYGGGITAGPGADVTIQNTIVSDNSATANGGGIYGSDNFLSGSGPVVTILDSQVSTNTVDRSGGGVAMFRGQLDMNNADVTGNLAQAGNGGGLFLSGLGGAAVNTTIQDSRVTGNFAEGRGGGINAGPNQYLRIDGTEISYNDVFGRGGGLYLSQQGAASSPLNVSITESDIVRNNADFNATGTSDAFAGGIWAAYLATVNIDATTVAGNSAASVGGGIIANGASTFEITDSTLVDNATGLHGGGAYLLNTSAVLEQTTIYGNRAYVHGGGLFVYSAAYDDVKVNHSTIARNFANLANANGSGGGIHLDATGASNGTVSLDHTIVGRNLAGLVPYQAVDISDSGAVLTASHSFVGINQGTFLPAGNPAPNGNIVGTLSAPLDPGLGPLAANGGPTLTMEPDPGSLVLNAGDPSFLPPPATDQRQSGFLRISGGRIDMGALERQPPPPVIDVDFNNDGVADCTDANALSNEIVAGTNNPALDLNGDGLVDHADFMQWLDDAPFYNGFPITHYLMADITLDGNVDGQDLLPFFAKKFTASANWCDGDFNIDGFIDGQDFVKWNSLKFQTSPPCPGGVPCPIVAPDDLPSLPTGDDAVDAVFGAGTPLNIPTVVDLHLRTFELHSDRQDEEPESEQAQLEPVLRVWEND